MHAAPQADNTDLNPALRLASARALLLTRGTGAAIALAHEGSLMCQASVGNSAPMLGCRLDTTSGLSGECVRTGKALRCDDSETDPRVDVASCRRLGIRSILAAPIPFGRNIVGLLEVFATQPFAFDDGHLALVERLAQTMLPTPATFETIPPPKLLVEPEPAYRVFFRNLIDMLLSPRTAPLKLTSLPAPFWTDVFVPSRLPWDRFLQSMLLHVIMFAALGGLLEFSLSQRRPDLPLAFKQSDIVYYSSSEYVQSRGTRRGPPQPSKRQQPGLAEQPVITVTHERSSPAPTIITPPNVKPNHELQLLHLVAWNSVVPAVPLKATTGTRLNMLASLIAVVAPPAEISQASGRRISTGLNSPAVIGPPPEISAPKARWLTTTPTRVIGPPPSVQQSVRQIGGIDIGSVRVVAPAPEISLHEPSTLSEMVMATLRGAASSIVPPAPRVNGSGSPGTQRMRSLSTTAMPVAVPPAAIFTARDVSSGERPIARNTYPFNVSPPERAIGNGKGAVAGTKELSVNFIGLALALPSSSVISSHEVFIAEDRLGRYQSRLIKLVYEFLPYQPRLSDYGPDYPAVDKLRVTRDPSCDETLMQVMSSVNVPGWPQPDRLRQDLKSSDQQERTLECYRTTADNYRRARALRH